MGNRLSAALGICHQMWKLWSCLVKYSHPRQVHSFSPQIKIQRAKWKMCSPLKSSSSPCALDYWYFHSEVNPALRATLSWRWTWVKLKKHSRAESPTWQLAGGGSRFCSAGWHFQQPLCSPPMSRPSFTYFGHHVFEKCPIIFLINVLYMFY